jgi:hypothetical protein
VAFLRHFGNSRDSCAQLLLSPYSKMHDVSAICCTVVFAIVLAGCVSLNDLPRDEQVAVACAQRTLARAPAVSEVEVNAGPRPVVAYAYLNSRGERVRSRIRIDGWARPGEKTSYYFEIIDDESMSNLSDLMLGCGLGQTVVTD